MTGSSIEAAKDLALDQLGVDETDAEFEVLEEPKTGLFGRTRGDAKVRARVRPSTPRPKQERRDRRRGGGQGGQGGSRNRGSRSRGGRSGGNGGGGGGGRNGERSNEGGRAEGQRNDEGRNRGGGGGGNAKKGSSGRNRRPADRTSSAAPAASEGNEENTLMTEAMTATEQGEIVKDFLEGLLDAFGADGEVDAKVLDEDIVEVKADGADLGLLIGPRGATLDAVQELARRSLQRQAEDTGDVRVRVDVGGYRERRRVALDRFARDAATKVIDSGSRLALEPMSAADRKVVHDAINDVDGVSTVSEGEDQRRRVVLVPDGDGDDD
jgi:spoIIIJ-associated protein